MHSARNGKLLVGSGLRLAVRVHLWEPMREQDVRYSGLAVGARFEHTRAGKDTAGPWVKVSEQRYEHETRRTAAGGRVGFRVRADFKVIPLTAELDQRVWERYQDELNQNVYRYHASTDSVVRDQLRERANYLKSALIESDKAMVRRIEEEQAKYNA